MKRFCLLLIALICTGLAAEAQDKEVVDKVVAVVGSELVLLSDIEDQYNYMVQQKGGVLPDNFRCDILDNLLASSLLLNQAKLDSIEVGDEEVDAQLSARFDQILNLMNNDPAQFEAYYGQTIPRMREKMRDDLKNQIMVERMRETIITEVSVTPAEVKAFFEKVPVDSLPYFNSEVELAEIVIKPEVNDVEKNKARERLVEIRKRIVEGGEDFGELAKVFSDDLGSGRAGGDLGNAKRGTYVPEFEAAAYQLKENEISDIVETQFGFHIIQMIKRLGNNIRVRHILIKPTITDDDLKDAYDKLDRVRNLLLIDSIGFSQAVKKYSAEDQQSTTNDGNIVNLASGNTFFEIGDLEPDVYFAIDTMDIGGISAPIPFQLGPGETAYRIVYLKSRTKPHKASLATDYSKIKAAAIEQKKSVHINKWVAERVSSTFINIDQGYQYCPIIQVWMRESSRP